MFTRNSDREAPPGVTPPATATPTPPIPPAAAATSPVKPVATNGAGMTSSVIGRDLTIIGSGLKIVSRGLLQVDGEVQGDVIGQKIVIGPTGKVTGLVNAEEILVQGSVFGTIKAVDVKLASSSVVEGDLYHQTFSLEQGAGFEGRSRRAASREELVPDLESLAPTSES